MPDLALESLEVQRFRAFNHLRLKRLGRVNLLTGKNNSGKSTLLEAVRIFGQRASPRTIWDLLVSRDELHARTLRFSDEGDLDRVFFAFEQLFYGRKSTDFEGQSFSIGPIGDSYRTVFASLHWTFQEGGEDNRQLNLTEGIFTPPDRARPVLTVTYEGASQILPLNIEMRFLRTRMSPDLDNARHAKVAFVSSHGIDAGQLGRLWDAIALTDLEFEVIQALRIVSPQIERISLVGDRAMERIVVARIPEASRPVPLKSMGEGMNRMLGIVLSLVSARDGMLIVDEIENGIHYSIQPNLWTLIFSVARRLNVQVFASTHSWDCINAFRQAAVADPYEEAALIRLENQGSEIRPTLFSERELAIATKQNIELR